MMAYRGKSVVRNMYFGAKPILFAHANFMRNNPTMAERVLWDYLKKLRSTGFIFRRQHPIDIFIADFYCHKIKLVIEVDGERHDSEDVKNYDIGRSAELERHGIKVVRFTNNQIINNIEEVKEQISLFVQGESSPSLLGEGDKRGRG